MSAREGETEGKSARERERDGETKERERGRARGNGGWGSAHREMERAVREHGARVGGSEGTPGLSERPASPSLHDTAMREGAGRGCHVGLPKGGGAPRGLQRGCHVGFLKGGGSSTWVS